MVTSELGYICGDIIIFIINVFSLLWNVKLLSLSPPMRGPSGPMGGRPMSAHTSPGPARPRPPPIRAQCEPS